MDQKLFLLINGRWINPALDWTMAALSSFDAWLPLLLLAALAAAWRGGFRVRAFLLVAALTVGLADGVVGHTLKRWADRPRPGDAMAGVRQVDLAKARPRFLALFQQPKVRWSETPTERRPGRSFPSSHTLNTSALAMLAAIFFARFGWMAWLLAAAIAYSRLYTGAHWPSDIAASLALGALLGVAAWLGAEAAWRRYGPHWAPLLAARHPRLAAAKPASA